eukprot:352120-Chlamydomonas_euryale.AAC.4
MNARLHEQEQECLAGRREAERGVAKMNACLHEADVAMRACVCLCVSGRYIRVAGTSGAPAGSGVKQVRHVRRG